MVRHPFHGFASTKSITSRGIHFGLSSGPITISLDSTLINLPTTVVEAPLISPVVGDIGSGAPAPKASRRNWTRIFLPTHWASSPFAILASGAGSHPDSRAIDARQTVSRFVLFIILWTSAERIDERHFDTASIQNCRAGRSFGRSIGEGAGPELTCGASLSHSLDATQYRQKSPWS